MKISEFLAALILTLASPLVASDNVSIKSSIDDITTAASGGIASIDLRDHFEVSSITGTLVRFETNLGIFHVEMFDSGAPDTVGPNRSFRALARFDGLPARATGARIRRGGPRHGADEACRADQEEETRIVDM